MADTINKFFESAMGLVEPVIDHVVHLIIMLMTSGAATGVFLILLYVCWSALSEALRCDQRARCFLRLLEIGLKQGRTIEETIASMSRARIRDMGVPFHLLAAWMDRGLRLGAALEEVPRFLPAPVAAMLRVGEATGNVPGMLRACRASLRGGISQATRQTNDYLVLLVVSPAGPGVLWVLAIFVLPKFRDLAMDMGVASNATMEFCFQASMWLGTIAGIMWLGLALVEIGRTGGQWLLRGVMHPISWVLDRLNLWIPWKRKRLQRDFAGTLASLLDGGVDEARAVRLSAEATANGVFRARAESVVSRMQEGMSLPDALASLDGTGEFQWRLRNASLAGHGFGPALAGWHESLEAHAFQQEQLFSQVMSTAFVLANGLMVGLAAVGVFHFLTGILETISW